MKQQLLLFLLLGIAGLSGCSKEEFHYHGYPDADVIFTYWTGPSGTIIEGEVYNDGETYLEAVELKVSLFDHHGDLINEDWYWINTFSYPGEETYFTFDLSIPYVDDVRVKVTDFDG
ncbi:MAG: hypothetical protein JXR19_07975 [Bacteroidia bacterium]